MRVFNTGDTHGDFVRVKFYCEQEKTTVDDVMIVLGDAGINYFGPGKEKNHDEETKRYISKLPITLLCIHGNHEMRPGTIPSYKTRVWNGGWVYYEEQYPNILFAMDGQIFYLNGKYYITIGGAYSVDKQIRLIRGYQWFEDEQPSEEIKRTVETSLKAFGWNIDVVLSHTCPLKYEPTEVFLSGIDQSEVDKSTEIWLNEIEHKLKYDAWYCGHFHTTKNIDKMHFRYKFIEEIK